MKIHSFFIRYSMLLALSTTLNSSYCLAQNKSLEVSHWWTSGGEAKAIDVLRKEMYTRGFTWKDSSVMGGGGVQQQRVLRARLDANIPPDAMMVQGNYVKAYSEQHLFAPLDDIAQEEKWEQLIPKPLHYIIKHNQHWMAVPINLHRPHWIWANKKIFDQLKLTPPKTFDEFINIAHIIKKAGYIPIAHGGQAWQNAILFDSTVLSVGGTSFYNKALVENDINALKSSKMLTVFERLAQIRELLDKDFVDREWNLATAMVMHDKAAMQIMGDWAKSEFISAGKKPNQDFMCFEFPGTQGSFLFISDLFGIVNAPKEHGMAQRELTRVILDKNIQERFNLIKGSIPVRRDIDMKNFDDCAKKSNNDFNLALKNHTAIERFDTRIPKEEREAIFNIVSLFIEKRILSPQEAVSQMIKTLQQIKTKPRK